MDKQYSYVKGETLYFNKLNQQKCIDDFISEGPMVHSIENSALVLKSDEKLDPDENTSHWVLWHKQPFPSNIIIEFEFKPLMEPGLAMLFFSATGKDGADLFDPTLNTRDGQYSQYHSGDVDTYHLSFFRRRWEEERNFHTCNLRKSRGFHLATQSPDPIPSVGDISDFYKIKLMKCEGHIQFYINKMLIFDWVDDGKLFGDLLTGGRIGIRQMAPLEAAYKNLRVSSLSREG